MSRQLFGKISSLPPMIPLYSYMTTTLTALLTPAVWVFPTPSTSATPGEYPTTQLTPSTST